MLVKPPPAYTRPVATVSESTCCPEAEAFQAESRLPLAGFRAARRGRVAPPMLVNCPLT